MQENTWILFNDIKYIKTNIAYYSELKEQSKEKEDIRCKILLTHNTHITNKIVCINIIKNKDVKINSSWWMYNVHAYVVATS